MAASARRRLRRAAKKARASAQGTTPRSTRFATMRAGRSCISAKEIAIWWYTGSSIDSRARIDAVAAEPPSACGREAEGW
jgi:hypothetical protein